MSDIYKSPESEVSNPIVVSTELASRGARFCANFIDMMVIMAVLLVGLYFSGFYDKNDQGNEPSDLIVALMSLGLAIIFFIINYRFLVESGQTLGKKILKIRIVSDSFEIADFQKHIIPRYMVYFFPGMIPVVGQLLSVINVVFIFRQDRKCIHDMLAKTKVVNC